MPARDIETQIKARVADEVGKRSFTDDLSWVAYPADGLVARPGMPPMVQTHWRVTVTIPSGQIAANMKTLTNLGECH